MSSQGLCYDIVYKVEAKPRAPFVSFCREKRLKYLLLVFLINALPVIGIDKSYLIAGDTE
jgi:hypothetical protein